MALTKRRVWVVAAVAVACAAVLSAMSGKAEATFPGENGKIAYASSDGNDWEIYTINPGGGGKSQVTHNNTDDFNPSYSPDGKKIAYTGYAVGSARGAIYTINVSGGGRFKVTEGTQPSYSPNGKRIAYAGKDGNDTEIYTINVGGRGRVQLTDNGTSDFKPSYSPTGKKIAYEGSKGPRGGSNEIYTINAGGGGKFNVTNDNSFDAEPDWSPDGERIAYISADNNPAPPNDSDIYTIKVGGGGKINLTNSDNADEFSPSYSPDGKKIAYQRYFGFDDDNDNDYPEIYTTNVGGGDKFRVTHNSKYEESPSWGPRP